MRTFYRSCLAILYMGVAIAKANAQNEGEHIYPVSAVDEISEMRNYRFGKYSITPIYTGAIATRIGGVWQKPEPVFTWLLCGNEDTLLIDSGLDQKMNSKNYFPFYLRAFMRRKYRFNTPEGCEVDNRLLRIGIKPSVIKTILLTHAHFDHTARIAYFKQSNILLSGTEKRNANGLLNIFKGYIPHALPHHGLYVSSGDNVRIPELGLSGFRIGDDLYGIVTRRHTAGHLMFLLTDGMRFILFTGDEHFDTIQNHYNDTETEVNAFISRHDCVLLNNHDEHAVQKLKAFMTHE